MNAPEIRQQLDDWLWALSSNYSYKPPEEELAAVRSAWDLLRPFLLVEYRKIVDDRLNLVDSYLKNRESDHQLF